MTLLKHVAEVRVSNVDKKSYDGEVPVRLCNYTDVYYGEVLSADDGDYLTATASREQLLNFRLEPGDTVLTKDSETSADIGVSAYIDKSADDFVCGYHLALLRPHPGAVHPKYLFWALRGQPARQQLSMSATGVTRFGLRTEALANVVLDPPSLPEQRHIADFLDEQVGLLERALALRERFEGLERERFAAWREQKLLGEATRWTPLQHLTEPGRPIVYGIVQAGPEYPGGVPYIKTGDMQRFEPDRLSRTAPDIDMTYRRSQVRPGDFVIAMRASIGALLRVPDALPHANLTQGTARIAPRADVDADWLYQVLHSRAVQEQFQVRAVGSTFRTLNIWDLRRVMVPEVPRTAQKRLGPQLTSAEAEHRRVISLSGAARSLLAERRQALITAAVTGQIDVTSLRRVA